MFLVRADDKTQLHSIAESFDAIDDFEHFDLGQMNSIALLDLCEESTSWMVGPPVAFDEAGGLVIVRFSNVGLAWLSEHADELEEFDIDAAKLRAFTSARGPVYAVDTF